MRYGFTLIELIIVLAILSSTIIAVAPIVHWMRHQGVSHAVEHLRGELQLARLMAIKKKQRCEIKINSPTQNHYINTLSQHSVSLDLYRGNVRFLQTGPDGKESTSGIAFNSQGMMPTVKAANIYLSNQNGNPVYRIYVMGAGGISVQRWAGKDWM
ncbi:MAG: prepilin-type N-terminal cleavage/methylation domain-containing protein [Desulfobacteraceae bacterium]|nr:prepilin-type N-terminal cleavage/methylation domain-containing protein [Desulfobacteraceae bacterium]